MNTSVTKTILAGISLVLLSGASSITFAQNDADTDELGALLNSLLGEADDLGEPDGAGTPPTVQDAEDIQDSLNGVEPEADDRTDDEALLDDQLGERGSAQAILDEDEKWTYAEGADSEISLESSTSTSAEFKITKVLYEGEEVSDYRIYYSESSLSSQKLELIKDVVVTKKDVRNDDTMVTVELEGLVPETRYFVVVSPVHPTDDTIEPLNVITTELNFSTKSEEVEEEPVEEEPVEEEPVEEEPVEEEPVEEEPAEVIDYITRITNSVNNNTVTVRWANTQETVDKIAVSLRKTGETNSSEIGTPLYADGEFTFQVSEVGTYFLTMTASDANGEQLGKTYSRTISVTNIPDSTQNENVVVTNPPKVGPTTDLLIGLLIFAMMMYMVMRFRRA